MKGRGKEKEQLVDGSEVKDEKYNMNTTIDFLNLRNNVGGGGA